MLTDNSLEIKTEADSNDITDCKPSTGMFGFYSYLHSNLVTFKIPVLLSGKELNVLIYSVFQ